MAMVEDTRQNHPADSLHEVPESVDVHDGIPLPWGTQPRGNGVNFSIFSRHATAVQLEFYDRAGSVTPSRTITLDPIRNRTGDAWHVWVRGVPWGQLYAYRIEGPWAPAEGHRFNVKKRLLDPYARAIAGSAHWDFAAARGDDPTVQPAGSVPSATDDAGRTALSVYMQEYFDWGGDRPPRHAASDTVIYETHVRGATIHPSSGVKNPGTYRGLTERIPYFRDLGVTTLELMPAR